MPMPVTAIRAGLLILIVIGEAAVFLIAGPRSALLILTGLGLGLTLEGLRFGFAGPWRLLITERDGRGLIAQFIAIGICAAVAFPLLAAFPAELTGAYAPVGFAMIAGAFIFGASMQVVMGCGSGTLANAGSGNLIALVALIGFIAGSFMGTLHLGWWTALGSLPIYTLQGIFGSTAGMVITLSGLTLLAVLVALRSLPGKRQPQTRLWIAAGLVAGLAILNLMIAGQPWGVVYGLGLWGAKVAEVAGMDVAATAFWSAPTHALRLQESLLTDVTSLTNIGLIAGAFIVMRWRRSVDAQPAAISSSGWALMLLAGLLMGYSARVAFGCNVGAFFSGVSTGSLHGWVWFVAAFAGSCLGIRLCALLMSAVAVPQQVVAQ
jgi:uncharacterized protein